MIMVSRYSFSCNECGNKFEIRGYWFNQFVLHWVLDYKYMIHKIIVHKRKPRLKYFLKMNLIAVPLFIFQFFDILLEPIRRIL